MDACCVERSDYKIHAFKTLKGPALGIGLRSIDERRHSFNGIFPVGYFSWFDYSINIEQFYLFLLAAC